jgi:hypothetical protein
MLGGMAPTGGSFMRCVQVGNMMNSTSATNNFRNTIIIDKTTTIRVLATRTGYIDSDVVTYTYFVDEDPPSPTKLNFSKLIEESQLINQRRCTPETRWPFANALSAAVIINNDANATQEQIDDAFATLYQAKEALKPVDADYVFETDIEDGKYVSILENLTAYDVEGTLVLAVYDLTGKLVKVEMVDFLAKADKSDSAAFTLNSSDYPTSGFKVKAFCWDTDCIPLTDAVVLASTV